MLFLFIFFATLLPPLSTNLVGDLFCYCLTLERRCYCTTTVLSEDDDDEELEELEAEQSLLLACWWLWL